MAGINQKEYLKKYLSIGSEPGKKKKRKKKGTTISDRVKIIDDDLDSATFNQAVEEDLCGVNEDAPQIVGVIDERPLELRIDDYRKSDKWQPLGDTNTVDSNLVSEVFKSIEKSRRTKLEDGALKIKDEDCSPVRKSDGYSPGRSKRTYDSPHRRNSDESPPRRSRRSDDSSPPRKNRKYDDSSPPRRKGRESEATASKSYKDYGSADGRRKRDSPDRRRKHYEPSPHRRSRRDSNESRNRKSEDASSSRMRKNSDASPPRKSGRGDDVSPPRRTRKDSDESPPRTTKRADNIAVQRRPRKDSGASPSKRLRNDSDTSPPRKSKQLGDVSPPRRTRQDRDPSALRNLHKGEDISPPRGSQKHSVSPKIKSEGDNFKPPRRIRSRWDSSPPRQLPEGAGPIGNPSEHYSQEDGDSNTDAVTKKMTKTLDGKTAGLQKAHELIRETQSLKKREDELFKSLSAEVSGVNAKTVIRDRKTGKVRDIKKEAEEEKKKREKEDENKEKYAKWGKGLKQVEDYNEKLTNDLYEMSKPLARYANDEDLEKHLKEQEREGDPMLAYMRKKKKKKDIVSGKPEKPQFEGEFMPNRYGIRPGFRWDGVDRSNGYEAKWFEVLNSRKAQQEEVYKWSTEDM